MPGDTCGEPIQRILNHPEKEVPGKLRISSVLIASAAIVAIGAAPPAMSGEQDAIDACIDKLQSVGGPDGKAGGEVLSSEFSEAAAQVMLRDAGGTVWRCLAYSDGTVRELSVSGAADDGGGVMAAAPAHYGEAPTTTIIRVRFERGSSGAELTAKLTPGSSVRYTIGAKNRQDLYVRVAAKGPDIRYQIFNPDDSFLLDQMTSSKEYRGELWQSGDPVAEVFKRGNQTTAFDVIFGIDRRLEPERVRETNPVRGGALAESSQSNLQEEFWYYISHFALDANGFSSHAVGGCTVGLWYRG